MPTFDADAAAMLSRQDIERLRHRVRCYAAIRHVYYAIIDITLFFISMPPHAAY